MPLTQEQFQKARQAGFTTDQIIGFEKKRETEAPQAEQPQQSSIPNQILGNALAFGTPPIAQMAVQSIPQVQQARRQYFQGENALVNPIRQGLSNLQNTYNSNLPPIARTTMSGMVGAGQNLPEAVSSLPLKPSEMATAGAIGMGAGKIWQGIKGFKPQNWLNPKNQVKVAEETRNALFQLKNSAVEKYGQVYDKVIKQGQGRVSLQEPLLNLIDESEDVVSNLKGQQEISEALSKGDPNATKVMNIVDAFMKNPKELQELSLQEADTLQKYIKSLPSISRKLSKQARLGMGQIDLTNAERVLVGFANDIKSQVLNLAPEMNLVNREYGATINGIKKLRPLVKEGSAITNFKNINILDPEKRAFFDILPKNTLQKILNINRAERAALIAKWAGGIVGGSALAGGVGSMAFKRR